MYCTNCGAKFESNGNFCAECGQGRSVENAPKSIPNLPASDSNQLSIAVTPLPAQSIGIQNSARVFNMPPTYSGLSMGQAIRSVFSKYASASGRATRSEYWFFALFNFLVIGGTLLIGFLFSGAGSDALGMLFGLIYAIFILAVLVPSITVSIRRLHDAGYSGWLYLLNLIPYAGALVIFVFMLLPSDTRDNRWGQAPILAPENLGR